MIDIRQLVALLSNDSNLQHGTRITLKQMLIAEDQQAEDDEAFWNDHMNREHGWGSD